MKNKTILILLASAALAGCGRNAETINQAPETETLREEEEKEGDTEEPEDAEPSTEAPSGETEASIEAAGAQERQEEEEEAAAPASGEEEEAAAGESIYRTDLPFDHVVAGSGTVTATGAPVNYREGPSVEYKILGTVSEGTSVTATGQCDDGTGWYVVEVNGVTAYMSNRWMKGTFESQKTEAVPASGEKEEEKEVESAPASAEETKDVNFAYAETVIARATEMAADKGYMTVQERLEQKVEDGKISQGEYDFLIKNHRGSYTSVTVEVTEDDVDAMASLVCSRLLPEEGTAFEFAYGGTLVLGDVRYAEFRCYTLD